MTESRAKVLIIDDEEVVCDALSSVLRKQGHEVSVACDGAQGLSLLLGDPGYDVVFCDCMMPGMGGIELYGRIRAARPALAERFVFMTGGALSQEAREFLKGFPPGRVLHKPFAMGTFRQVVSSFRAGTDRSIPG